MSGLCNEGVTVAEKRRIKGLKAKYICWMCIVAGMQLCFIKFWHGVVYLIEFHPFLFVLFAVNSRPLQQLASLFQRHCPLHSHPHCLQCCSKSRGVFTLQYLSK